MCASLELAEAELGSSRAQEIITVIADVEATSTAQELIDLYGSHAGTCDDMLSIQAGENFHLLFLPVGKKATSVCGRGIDWRQVDRLKLMDAKW